MSSIRRGLNTLSQAFIAALRRLDTSFNPNDTLAKLKGHQWTYKDGVYLGHIILASFWLVVIQVPSFPAKLLLPILYGTALLIPFTSQFFLPATPVFAWLFAFYSNQFIPANYRPSISVSLLPTLESVLYGANVSDILTRFTHPLLDIVAWIPYGVGHYVSPVIVSIFLWLFRPKAALVFWGSAFGYMNLTAVLIQILLPCAPPWYELIYGLTPADYSIRGSAAGLGRIDTLFGSQGYKNMFDNSPLVFGAFPSLHAGWVTLEALFVSHFFPHLTPIFFTYAGVLYWATMYLTHHYLIDVVSGACLATAFFYLLLPDALRGPGATALPSNWGTGAGGVRNKYETYDLERPPSALRADDFEVSSEDEEEGDLGSYRSPQPQRSGGGGHRHTASIASLIRSEDRREEGWASPIGTTFATTPRTPNMHPSEAYPRPKTPTLERAPGTPTRDSN